MGTMGSMGNKGIKGNMGHKGIMGNKGNKGNKENRGIKGIKRLTFRPEWSGGMVELEYDWKSARKGPDTGAENGLEEAGKGLETGP
jgi:hypothetical protein